MTGGSTEGGSGSSGHVVGGEGEEGAAGKRARRWGADGEGRLEFYLCDVGSTNGTYVQVIVRSAVGLIGGMFYSWLLIDLRNDFFTLLFVFA